MLDVCIALLPALAMGTWVLGVRSLLVVAVSILVRHGRRMALRPADQEA